MRTLVIGSGRVPCYNTSSPVPFVCGHGSRCDWSANTLAPPRQVRLKVPPAPRIVEDIDVLARETGEARAALMQPPAIPFVGLWSLVAALSSVLTILTTQLPDGFVRSTVALVVAGLVQPLLEWLILRRYLPALPLLQWWAYNIVGLILGALLLMLVGVMFIMVGLQFGSSQATGTALAEASGGPIGVIVTSALVGLATAGARWLLLRRFFEATPVLFFAGTILGLVASGFVGQLAFLPFERGTLAADLAGNLIGALVSGGLTGAGVLTLFRGHAVQERAT